MSVPARLPSSSRRVEDNEAIPELVLDDLPDASIFREMVDQALQGIVVHNGQRLLYVNDAWAVLHGFSVAEVLAMPSIYDFTHELDRERLQKYRDDRLAGLKAPERYRYRAAHRDGRAIWFEQLVRVIDWQGQPAVMNTVINVDGQERQVVALRQQRRSMKQEVQQRSEALIQSNRELYIHQSILDQLSERISVVGTDYRFRMSNQANLDFRGSTREQLIGQHLRDVQGEAYFEGKAKAQLEQTFNGESVRSESMETAPDGTLRYVQVTTEPFRDPDQTISGAIVSVCDITAAKEAEQELHLFASVIEQSADRISVIDLNYQIIMTNAANIDFHQRSKEAIVGRPLAELVGEDTFHRFSKGALDRCFKGEEVRFRRPHKDQHGHDVTIEVLLEPFRELDGRISGAIARLRDVTEAQAMSEKLAYQARYDQLTGLLNRQAFERLLEKSIGEVSKGGRSDVLCFIDLDQFKVVNDTVGHLAGDTFLKQVAELLSSKLHDDDVLARFGGDEFVLLLRNCSLRRAKRACERLIEALTDYRFFHEGLVFRVGASIGITVINRHATSAGDMMVQADLACYAAKDNGRHQVQIYKKRDAFIRRRQDDMYRAGRIRSALDEDRFVLFSQVIAPVRQSNDAVSHVEILLRQRDRSMKIVKPDGFIPAAERYGLMAELDRWVIRKTIECLTNLCEPLVDTNVSINLSGTTLSDDTSLDYIRRILTMSGVSPKRILFEITETAAIRNIARTEEFMAELRGWGCSFALDDFGSGLSSLSYLKRLPVDYLKIDGSFIRDLATDRTSHTMVKAIIQMAADLQIKTVAEGVESNETLEVLRPLGIDYVQGYAVALPTPLCEHNAPSRQEMLRKVATSSRRR